MQMFPASIAPSQMHSQPRQFRSPRPVARCTALILIGLAASPFTAASLAQSAPAPPLDGAALVRRAVQHRLDSEKAHHPMQYLLRSANERRDTTKLIIETKDGDVARLVAINGNPLDADANQAELVRLDNLAQHPELQEKRRKSEQKDEERVDHLLSELPEAFLYKLEGVVPCPSGQCYKLSYTPNPHFDPPDTESQLLRGTSGEVWIDQTQERLDRLEAHFISDVDFGFGIIAKLNKGGTVTLVQNDVGGHDWELTDLQIHVTGKILVVKSMSSQIREEMSHFTPVAPGLRYRDAIQLLKKYDPSTAAYTP
jgi:hypothetical protein